MVLGRFGLLSRDSAIGSGFGEENPPFDPLESVLRGEDPLLTVTGVGSVGFPVGPDGLNGWVGFRFLVDSPSYTHKKKKFPIINTTTNHTNPPLSQPNLQTTITNTKNPNTPTQNLQIGDSNLSTQTYKHKKSKPKPRNPWIEDQNHENEEWVSVSGYIFMRG